MGIEGLCEELKHAYDGTQAVYAHCNDSRDNISATIDFIKQLDNVSSVDVLPYHQAARAKYRKLGSVYPGNTILELENSILEQTVTLLNRRGLEAVVGG